MKGRAELCTYNDQFVYPSFSEVFIRFQNVANVADVPRPLVDKDLVIRGSDEQITLNLLKSRVNRLNLWISWTWRLGMLIDLSKGV